MYYVLFNPKADNSKGEANAKEVTKNLKNPVYKSVLDFKNAKDFFKTLKKDDVVYFVGGDGTLNHLANDLKDYDLKNDIYYLKAGSGNDFYRDSEKDTKDGMIHLNRYLRNLPTVKVNGKEMVFLNGVGYGIDGETCKEGDHLKEVSTKPVNYANIAVKLCLFKYKKNIAHIVIDGKEYDNKNVWLASTMKGKYYGGGMKVAPNQDRFNPNHTLTFVCLHKWSRLVTLIRFSSLFKGEHIKWKDWCYAVEGKEVTVTFKYPCAIQIDGEVIDNVTTYTARI